jgi:hypothetical protein
MKKAILYLILIGISLSSCKTSTELEKMYRADYYNYSCPQLYQKYVSIKSKLEQERQHRFALNTANAVVGIIDPYNVRTNYNSSSYKERDFELQMKALENLAIDKHCVGVSFN